jgi:hypothetical protein
MSMKQVAECGAWVGPIWKLGGETCVCIDVKGHVERKDGVFGDDHICSCGAWFVDEITSKDFEGEL